MIPQKRIAYSLRFRDISIAVVAMKRMRKFGRTCAFVKSAM